MRPDTRRARRLHGRTTERTPDLGAFGALRQRRILPARPAPVIHHCRHSGAYRIQARHRHRTPGLELCRIDPFVEREMAWDDARRLPECRCRACLRCQDRCRSDAPEMHRRSHHPVLSGGATTTHLHAALLHDEIASTHTLQRRCVRQCRAGRARRSAHRWRRDGRRAAFAAHPRTPPPFDMAKRSASAIDGRLRIEGARRSRRVRQVSCEG